MSKIIKFFIFTIIFAFLIFIGIIYFRFDDNTCSIQNAKSVLSPSKKSKILIFSLNCGAISDFSTQISVVESNYILGDHDIGNIFSADSNHNTAKMVGEILDMKVKWLNDKNVEIFYPKNTRIFKRKANINGINIFYKESKLK